MAAVLNPGSLEQLKAAGSVQTALTLKLVELTETNNGKFKCVFSDEKENISGVITSQVARQFGDSLKSNGIVKVTEGNVNSINDKAVLIVAAMEILTEGTAAAAPAAAPKPDATAAAADVDMVAAATVAATEAKTPAVAPQPAPGAPPRSGPTPPSGPRGATRPAQPIGSLNPYVHGWTIRAKVVSKGPKRSFTTRATGASASVFNAELVDAEGTAIEATFWREAADRYHDLLTENSVFTFARGQVKPANKQYARVRNDYCLNFDAACEVEASEGDIVTPVKLAVVPIEQLAAYVDRKAPIDVLGVVTAVAPLGSVKRKSDASELSRRDVTIVDAGGKTVSVTLWGALAEGAGAELETAAAGGTANPIVAISSCRVSSYNGVSVSTLSRSQVLVDPSGDVVPEADALRGWWAASGADAAGFTAVGEGMATALKPGGAGASAQRKDLSAVRTDAPATADARPVFSTVIAAVAAINPDQSMWYLACPENNRKVVEQDGGYFCEYDGKTYGTATRRYIMQARFADASGELPVQVFNDQAEILLGRTADEAAQLRDGGDATAFSALLKGATWSEWVLRVKAQAQEYNGETRQRYAIAEMRPLDYAQEAKRALAEIAAC